MLQTTRVRVATSVLVLVTLVIGARHAHAGCFDHVLDDDESDIDCGGTSACRRCLPDERCSRGSDCVPRESAGTGFCEGGRCRRPRLSFCNVQPTADQGCRDMDPCSSSWSLCCPNGNCGTPTSFYCPPGTFYTTSTATPPGPICESCANFNAYGEMFSSSSCLSCASGSAPALTLLGDRVLPRGALGCVPLPSTPCAAVNEHCESCMQGTMSRDLGDKRRGGCCARAASISDCPHWSGSDSGNCGYCAAGRKCVPATHGCLMRPRCAAHQTAANATACLNDEHCLLCGTECIWTGDARDCSASGFMPTLEAVFPYYETNDTDAALGLNFAVVGSTFSLYRDSVYSAPSLPPAAAAGGAAAASGAGSGSSVYSAPTLALPAGGGASSADTTAGFVTARSLPAASGAALPDVDLDKVYATVVDDESSAVPETNYDMIPESMKVAGGVALGSAVR